MSNAELLVAIKEPKGERHGHIPYRKKGSTSKHQESEKLIGFDTNETMKEAVAVRRPLFPYACRNGLFFCRFQARKGIYLYIYKYLYPISRKCLTKRARFDKLNVEPLESGF